MRSLDSRVETLEREVKHWRIAGAVVVVAVSLTLAVAAVTPQQQADVLRAKRVEAEHVSIVVNGKERVALGVDDQGPDNLIAGLFLYRGKSKSNDDCARFVVFGQNDEPELVLKNREMKFQAWLRTESERGGATLSLCDPQGMAVESLSSSRAK